MTDKKVVIEEWVMRRWNSARSVDTGQEKEEGRRSEMGTLQKMTVKKHERDNPIQIHRNTFEFYNFFITIMIKCF